MFATSANVATKLRPLVGQTTRKMSVISGPPQVRLSSAEKAVHGFAITLGIMLVPAWVLANVKNYRARG